MVHYSNHYRILGALRHNVSQYLGFYITANVRVHPTILQPLTATKHSKTLARTLHKALKLEKPQEQLSLAKIILSHVVYNDCNSLTTELIQPAHDPGSCILSGKRLASLSRRES